MGQEPEEKISLDKLLTPVEHFFMGSILPEGKYKDNPDVPVILIEEGVSPERVKRVIEQRQEKGEFSNLMVGAMLFGLDPLKYPVLIRLAELDSITGRTLELPGLSGIKKANGEIERENLERYQLTEEDKGHLLEAFPTLSIAGREHKG